MSKPIEYTAALVIYNQDHSKFYLTRRPLDDKSMPGYWGFPSASKENLDEPWEETIKKAAKTKLGIKVKVIKYLGEMTIDRGKYILVLRDYEVKIIKGEPKVPQKFKNVTQYINEKWTEDPQELIKPARDGSLCSRVFLRSLGISWD